MNNISTTSNDCEFDYLLSDSEIMESMFSLPESSTTFKTTIRSPNGKKKSLSQQADEIVERYLEDKSDAHWKDLQEFFWHGLNSFAYKYTQNWSDAYDMTIETFIKVLECIDTYSSSKGKFSTWLWTICKNNCLYFMKQKTKLSLVDNDLSNIYDSVAASGDVSYQTNADYKVSNTFDVYDFTKDDVTGRLFDASIYEITSMDATASRILTMKLLDNMKIKDIADTLDMNESTVKNILYKGKEQIASLLKSKHSKLYDMYVTYSDEETLYA